MRRRKRDGVDALHVLAFDAHGAGVGSISRLTSRSSVVLPEPDGPTMARNSRSRNVERDAVEHRRGAAIALGDVVERDDRGCRAHAGASIAGRHSTVTPLALIGPLQRAISPATNLREILRRPAVGGGDFLADRLEAPAHRGQVERLAERRAELRDDRRRRVLGEEQALPGQHVEIEALLLGGRDVRQRRRTFQAGGGDGLDLAAFDLRLRGRNRVADVLHAAGDQVLHRRAEAAIGHVGDVHAEHGVEQDAAHMRGGAGARRGELDLVLVRLHVGDELLHRVGRQVLRHDDDARRLDREAKRREVLDRVVGRRLVERLAPAVRAVVAEHELRAVRRAARHAQRADRAAGADRIFHDDGLAERVAACPAPGCGRRRRSGRRRRTARPARACRF